MNHPTHISINCDMAESFGAYAIGQDVPLLDVISAANVACGFHAGDPMVMRAFVEKARDASVSIGAHPGFPDLQGFGRRQMTLSGAEVEAMVAYQIGALQAIARYAGLNVSHVKPHGALSNMAAENPTYADAIARAIATVDRDLVYVVHFGSEMHRAAEDLGLPHAREGYADRLYADDGNLAPRSLPGSVIHEPEKAARQALRLVRDRRIETIGGRILDVEIDTICVHGDQPGAVPVARAVRQIFEAHGIEIKPIIAAPNTPGFSRLSA